MYAIKKPEGEVTFNKDEIIRVVEDFYRDLYNSNEQPRIEANGQPRIEANGQPRIEANEQPRIEANGQPGIEANAVPRDVPNIATEEIKRALKGMKREKTPDEDGIGIHLIIDAEEIATVPSQRKTYESLEECNNYFDT